MTENNNQSEITPDIYLLKGPMLDLKTMTKSELKMECEMWRNIWDWVPSEVKYYVARTGQLVGVRLRNYKRYTGKLLATHWDIKEIELGVDDFEYDTQTGQRVMEHKVIRMGMGGIMDFEIIYNQISEQELIEQEQEINEQSIDDSEPDE